MTEELFTDSERQLLIVLATQAMVRIQSDPDMDHAVKELHDILSKLYGTDTILVARRAYPSRGLRLSDTDAQDRTNALYRDPRFPSRECDFCHTPYTGPSCYCSLKCTLADA
jgi:hypothetical protein